MSRPSGCTDSTDGSHTYCIFTSPSRLRAESFWDGFCGCPIRSMWLSIWVESHPSLACSNTVVNVASSLYPRGVSMKLILTCQSGSSNDNSIFWHRGIYIRCRADKLPYLVVLFLSCRIDLWSWPTHCPRGQRLALMHSIQKHTLSKYTRKAYRYGTLYLCVRRRNTIISSHATS